MTDLPPRPRLRSALRRPGRRHSRLPMTALAALLASLGCGAARADEPNPWYIGVSQTFTYESNLYRAGDQQQLPAGTSKSDMISSTALIGGIDQPIGRQRVYGSVNIGENRYQRNSNLNTPSHTFDLALDWATVERLSGTLKFSDTSTQAEFNSVNAQGGIETLKNIEDTRKIDAVARVGLVTKLTAEAKLGHETQSYSAVAYQFREYNQNTGSLGLRYHTSGLLTLGIAGRQTRGEYPNFIETSPGVFQADKFTRQDLDLTADWVPSRVSTVFARISATRTNYDIDNIRDSSGPTGVIRWDWKPTGKTKFLTDLTRDFGQRSDSTDFGSAGTGVTNFSQSTTAFRVRAFEEVSGKVTANASAQWSHRSLVDTQAIASGEVASSDGTDNTTTLGLGARWTPTRNTALGCDLSYERRRANSTLSSSMTASSIGCYGQITLQ
jgi:hypothetical protein